MRSKMCVGMVRPNDRDHPVLSEFEFLRSGNLSFVGTEISSQVASDFEFVIEHMIEGGIILELNINR